MRNKLLILGIVMLFLVLPFVFSADSYTTKAVVDPTSCDKERSSTLSCDSGPPQKYLAWVDTSSIDYDCYTEIEINNKKPSSDLIVTTKNYADYDGGYIFLCAKPSTQYHSNQANSWFCDSAYDCRNKGVKTKCIQGKLAGDSGAYSCTETCLTNRYDCNDDDGDSDKNTGEICEISYNSNCDGSSLADKTYGDNTVFTSSCDTNKGTCECKDGYVDVNGPDDGSDSDGCEVKLDAPCKTYAPGNVEGKCTDGLVLTGTMDNAPYSDCFCQTEPIPFLTGESTVYSSTTPLLWGTQLGTGWLMNLTGSDGVEFVGFNSNGCLQFFDGSSLCSANGGTGGIQPGIEVVENSLDPLIWATNTNKNGYLMNLTNATGQSLLVDNNTCIEFYDGTTQCTAYGGGQVLAQGQCNAASNCNVNDIGSYFGAEPEYADCILEGTFQACCTPDNVQYGYESIIVCTTPEECGL